MTFQRLALRNAAHVTLGRQRSPEHETGENMVPYLRAANVKDAFMELGDVKQMNFTPPEQDTFGLREGDVLVTEGSGSLSAVGASAVWRGELEGTVCFQNTLLRLRPRDDRLLPEYLAYWARACFGSGLFAAIAAGANIYHLSADRVRALAIELPDVKTQARLVAVLDEQVAEMSAVEGQLEAIRSLLEERSVVATHGLLRGPKGTEWPMVPLKHRWQVVDCKHRTPSYEPSGYPVVSPGDISPGHLNLDRCDRFVSEADYLDLTEGARKVLPGDIVYSRNASIGIAAFVGTTEPFTMGQDVCRITSHDQNQLYLAHYLNTSGKEQLEAIQVGTTFNRINIRQILDVSVPLPPPDEQDRIAQEIDAMLVDQRAGLAAVDSQLALLHERRRALITEAVTGKLKAGSRT